MYDTTAQMPRAKFAWYEGLLCSMALCRLDRLLQILGRTFRSPTAVRAHGLRALVF